MPKTHLDEDDVRAFCNDEIAFNEIKAFYKGQEYPVCAPYADKEYFKVSETEQLVCKHKYQDNVCDWRGVRECIVCGSEEQK